MSSSRRAWRLLRHALPRAADLGTDWLPGLLVAGVFGSIWLWRRGGVRQAGRIVDAATRLREGDYSARTGIAHDASPIGTLADTFDTMASALQQRAQENDRLIAAAQHLNQALEQRVTRRTAQLASSNRRLEASETELRRLSQQLMEVTEQERTRLSRDIHDQLGQALTAVKIELVTARRKLHPGQPEVLAKLDDAVDLVDGAIRTVRRIATDIRPGVLDDFGLEAAVEWQIEEFAQRTGLHCALVAEMDETRLNPALCTAAFRILQEALTNVARHAQASEVQVTLLTNIAGFTLAVTDNGKGINIAELPLSNSLGFLGMRERALQFGGRIQIDGIAGEGTTVTLSVPWHAPAEEESV